MSTQILSTLKDNRPSLPDHFIKPWNVWSDNFGSWNRLMNVPAVNIEEDNNEYRVTVAAPGLKKEDIQVDVDGNMLIIRSEHEENKKEKNKKFTREEYNYSSFSRSLILPNEIDKEKIEAKYKNGVLKISLPRVVEALRKDTKHIAVN